MSGLELVESRPEIKPLNARNRTQNVGMPPTPYYLQRHYWWAYVRPWAVRFWDRTWLLNLILYGNYSRLRDATLAAAGDLAGRILQVACCYGDLTPRLAVRAARAGGSLEVIDVLPIQLEALRNKLPEKTAVTLRPMDASVLTFPSQQYDSVLIFFLFHEQPQAYREKTLREALRVLKPGGRIIITDFAVPRRWHPIRLWLPFLGKLEPFAVALWNNELGKLLPEMAGLQWERRTFFGNLFQVLIGKHE